MGENVTAAILLRLASAEAEEKEMIPKHPLQGKNVEYRVREIKRYTVTRHQHTVEMVRGELAETCGSTRQVGSGYDNFETAYAVAYALCQKEHQDLGYPIDDRRIQYPISQPPGTVMTLDPSFHSKGELREIGSVTVTADGELEAS